VCVPDSPAASALLQATRDWWVRSRLSNRSIYVPRSRLRFLYPSEVPEGPTISYDPASRTNPNSGRMMNPGDVFAVPQVTTVPTEPSVTVESGCPVRGRATTEHYR